MAQLDKVSVAVLLSKLDQGIVIVDENNRVNYINKTAASLFNVPLVTDGALTLVEVVRDYEFMLLLQRCKSAGEDQESLIKIQPGDKILNVTVTPVIPARIFIFIISDLTEKRRLETIHRDFISNISHELRTPIASIKAISETLQEGAISDQTNSEKFIRLIESEADRLIQMVDELGELMHLENRESYFERGVSDIRQLIDQSVNRLQAQANRRGLLLKAQFDNYLQPVIIDKNRIEQVLINLIYNAIKFTGPGGKIVVKAAKEANNILVSVTDTCCGIARDELPRVFERFYKVDKSRAGEGTGLGLSISRHIINAHGGRIWAASEERKGSTFYFTLPLRHDR